MPRQHPRPAPTVSAVLDNRPAYLSFGFAWLLGYGAFALAADPGLPIPSAVPAILLGGGLLAGVVITSIATARAQRGPEAVVGTLLAASWLIGFGALFLIITGLSAALHEQQVQTLLWPTGSGLVVGLLHLAAGVAHRDVLQYTLGSWLAVMSSAALFLDGAHLFWALALAGGGGYLTAAALEPRRRAGTSW